MTPEQIIEMAKQADIWQPLGLPSDWDRGDYVASQHQLQTFAKLVHNAALDVATALRTSLAEPAAEPVAWWVVNKTTDEKFATTRPDDWNNLNWLKYPLFTSPPPPAEVPLLTDAQLDTVRQWFNCVQDTNVEYLEQHDYALAKEIYERLGRRVPISIEQAVRQNAGLK